MQRLQLSHNPNQADGSANAIARDCAIDEVGFLVNLNLLVKCTQ
jgi:hypothetical protein